MTAKLAMAVTCLGLCGIAAGPRERAPQAADAPDQMCGTIVGEPRGHDRLLRELERARKQAEQYPVRAQAAVWAPAAWTAGTALRVHFLDGDVATRAFVMNVAKEWLDGLNLGFVESPGPTAEIRVTFMGKGLWSKLGRTAQFVPEGQPTMGLAGLLLASDADVRRAYVLHEFGHALGALHEHQRPGSPLRWKPAVYTYYLNTYGWSAAQVDAEVILPFTDRWVVVSPEFDRLSVMMYPLRKEFTEEQFVQPWNSRLTTWDRRIMAVLYP